MCASVKDEDLLDMLVSNKRFYMFDRDLGWGTIRAAYSAGAVWCPGFSNYLFLIQATDMFTYNMVHCPGKNNEATANKLLDTIVDIVEGAARRGQERRLKDLISESI